MWLQVADYAEALTSVDSVCCLVNVTTAAEAKAIQTATNIFNCIVPS